MTIFSALGSGAPQLLASAPIDACADAIINVSSFSLNNIPGSKTLPRLLITQAFFTAIQQTSTPEATACISPLDRSLVSKPDFYAAVARGIAQADLHFSDSETPLTASDSAVIWVRIPVSLYGVGATPARSIQLLVKVNVTFIN